MNELAKVGPDKVLHGTGQQVTQRRIHLQRSSARIEYAVAERRIRDADLVHPDCFVASTFGLDPCRDVGDLDIETAYNTVDDVGQIRRLGVARRAPLVGECSLEQLLAAGECILDIGQIQGVDVLAQHLPDVTPRISSGVIPK